MCIHLQCVALGISLDILSACNCASVNLSGHAPLTSHTGVLGFVQVTDETFLGILNGTSKVVNHEHYESRTQKKYLTDSTLPRNAFRLRHYAGNVTYTVDSFLDKNRDILYFVCVCLYVLVCAL